MLFSTAIHGDLRIGVENVSRFPAFERCDFLEQVGIPGFAETDGLRKLRGRKRLQAVAFPSAGAAERHAVQSFEMSGADDAQARHVGIGTERGDFFFGGHERKDVVDARFNGKIGILEWILVLRGFERGAGGEKQERECRCERGGVLDVHGVATFWAS